MSAATRLRRLDESAQITVLERSGYVALIAETPGLGREQLARIDAEHMFDRSRKMRSLSLIHI